MPRQQKDALFQLIKSLSKAEKRHFKLYARRNVSKSEALFIQLFDAIDRQKAYDEPQILSRVPAIKKSQLPNLRSNLYRQILVALRLLHRTQRVQIQVREQLDFAQILYGKGLYRQSLAILERARSKANELGLHPLALEIISFEKLIESQHITRSIDNRAELLAAHSAALSQRVSMENAFANLSLQLYGLYLKMGYARNAEELAKTRQFFKKYLPEFKEKDLGFYERIFLFQSYVWLYNITQEFPRQYRYAQKWVDLFHDQPEMIRHNIPLYLKGMHNLLNALYLTLQYDKFSHTLKELSSFNSDETYSLTKNEESLFHLFTYIHKLNKHNLDGTFKLATTWVGELEEILASGAHNWDDHRVMVFQYKIACIHFSAGDNEQAIEFLNKIINYGVIDFRADIQCFARILNLIAHFELGNDVLVSYQLKSVYRFLLKMEELNAIHREIFKFLRKTPTILRSDLRSEFVRLKDTLMKVRQRRFEKRSFLYLDIISWLESKIDDIPVQDVIRQKFLSREKSKITT